MQFEIITEDFVIVTNNVFGCFIESKRFTKLLNSPLRVRICSNRKVQYFTSIVSYGNKHVYCIEENCSYNHEVNTDDMLCMVPQEC